MGTTTKIRLGIALPWVIAASSLGALFLAAGVAAGHERPEHRRVLISVEPGRTDVLIAYDLKPGRLASRLRAAIDHNGDGAASSAFERLAQAQILLPRVARDIELRIAGRRRSLSVSEFHFENGTREGRRQGLTGMVRYCVPAAWSDRFEQAFAISLSDQEERISVEFQVAPGIELLASTAVSTPDDPVVGPIAVHGGRDASIRVRLGPDAGPRVACQLPPPER